MTPGRRPPPIVLDDLAEPRFSDDVAAILVAMSDAGSSVALDPEGLVSEAVAQTGLDDFGPPDALDRLDVLCAALRTEGRLNGAGRLAQALFVGGLLRNRLLLEDLIGRHPEILEVEVARPIIICGLPRTGTTHLHTLLSCDPGLRSLPYWESLEPVPADGERPEPGAADPRRERTEAALSFVDAALPEFKRMHEMGVDLVHEEIQLLAIDVSTMLFETIAPIPSWRDHYLGRDQRPSYAYLKRILQALQWLRGGSRWVLKSPQHLEQFPALVSVFPDATFVVTHRDPVAVTTSMVTMLAYSGRLSHDHVDLEWIGRYWADRLALMLGRCCTDRDALPAAQSTDVTFAEFMEDEMGTVERIYDLAAQPLTPEARSAMESFVADHPRGRHGGIVYDLAPFGLDRDGLRSELARYADHFGLAPEP